MGNTLKVKRGTNLSNAGTPAAGELIYKTDTNELFVGDGSTAATGLTAIGGSGSGDIEGVTAGTGLSGGGSSGTVTLNIDSTVATLTGSQTLTNKTIASPTFTGDIDFSDASTPQLNITDTTNTITTRVASSDTNGTVGTTTDHNLNIIRNNVGKLTFFDTYTMHNNGGNDLDFRAKDSSGNVVFKVDAGTSKTIITTLQSETIDVAGDLTLDADGADVILKDGGTEYGRLTQLLGGLTLKSGSSSANAVIFSTDGDAIFAEDVSISAGKTFTFDSVGLTAVQTSSESFADNNTSLMTSAAINDRIESFGYVTSDTTLSTEQVQDIVGAMFSSNTETRISATYQDGDGTIDLVVDDMTANTEYSAGTGLDLSGTTFSVDVSDFMTGGVNNRVLTASGADGINAEANLAFNGTQLTNTGDIKIASGSLGIGTNPNSANGRIAATSHIEAGVGSGAIGLTINDGGGNSNVTFNHTAKIPEQNGQAARIEVNTDATSSEGLMSFELSNADVTAGSSVSLQNAMNLAHDYMDIPYKLRHMGDNDTYLQFDNNRLRLYAGGTLVIDSNNTYLTSSGILDQDDMSSNSATAVASQQSIKAYVDAEVAGIVNSAPAALNTLDELAAALGDDANFATTTSTSLGNRLRVDTASQGLTGTQQANAITNLGITATKAELNYVDGVTSAIQTQLNGKLSTSGTAANSTLLNNLGAGSFLRSDADDTWSGNISTTSTNGIRFGNANQTDGNDGYIAAGRFASGLNIVGTQTVSGQGRKVRIYGDLIDSAGVAYIKTDSSLNGDNISSGTVAAARIANLAASKITSGTFDAARIAHNSFDIGDTTAETGRSVHETGIYTFNRNNGTLGTGTDSGYYSVLAFGQGAGGSAQIGAKWYSGTPNLYFRTLRDTTDDWQDWQKLLTSSDTAANSQLLDSIDSTGFTRKGVQSGTPNTASNRTTFTCNDAIETSNGNQSGLEVWQDTSGADAFMTFHVAGDYAGYFGLDGSTNDLSWGGWSNGNGNKYRVFHAGNSTNITSVGTINTGTWNGSVIASAYLDSDTAHLSGTQTFSGAKTFTARTTFDDSGADGVLFKASDNASNSSRAFFDGTSTSCIFQEGNDLSFRVNATTGSSSGTERMYIREAGMALSNASLGVNASINGTNGMIHASNDIVAFASDKRLKENIRPIENALDKVNKLSGFVYNWNELANEKAEYDMDKDYVGVYAQDVEEVQPEAVDLAPFDNDGEDNSISGENYLTVQYEKLVPLLIESIKELKAEIEELKK